jgi:hypothetical protein
MHPIRWPIALALVLASGLYGAPLAGQGGSRVITRADLPTVFQRQFLGAALAGGVLGGLVAYMYAKRRTRSVLRQYLLKGILARLLTCVVYFGLGITLIQFDVKIEFFSELAVFAVAALAGAFGITLLAPGRGQGARA